jgi:predicted nucleotidyltransferase
MLTGKLRDCLMPRQELLGAWLFGSQASGRARPDSDVDIAVLADRPLTLDERLSLQLEVESALGKERVDIVDLRCATPILRFEAMQGVRVFVRSPDKVAVFSSLVGREYESDMALIQRGYRDRKDRRAVES